MRNISIFLSVKKTLRVVAKITKYIVVIVGFLAFIKESKLRRMDSKHEYSGFYEKYLKRPLDAMIAASLLLIGLPFIFVKLIKNKIKYGSEIFKFQDKSGKNGRFFQMMQFRPCKGGKRKKGCLLSKVPELINILKGDMSFVGPCPLEPKYVRLYNNHQRRRQEVRPGVTGLAQIHKNNMNSIVWEKIFDWDVKYVDNVTLLGDLKILFSTFKNWILRKNTEFVKFDEVAPFEGTMHDFN